jgi:uncharacterized protein
MTAHLELDLHDELLAVCRLGTDEPTPVWVEAASGPLVSITRTRDEVSVVVAEEHVPPAVRAQTGWRALSVRGPLAFSMVGVLAALAVPLAEAQVPISSCRPSTLIGCSSVRTGWTRCWPRSKPPAIGCTCEAEYRSQHTIRRCTAAVRL